MKHQRWKQPQMVLVYGAVGAVIGGIVGPYIYSSLSQWATTFLDAGEGTNDAFSGIPGIFVGLGFYVLARVLGAVTGCLFVHAWGKYRHIASIGFLTSGCLFGILSANFGFSFAGSYGRRAALATYGVYFLWSFALVIWGGILFAKSRDDSV